MKHYNRKILIVDDDSTNLLILNETLKEGYDLFSATNGANAIETANRILPDLILLDDRSACRKMG